MQTSQRKDDKQVIVIGGGPGGSTVAALLARAGRRVTLLEKGHHPRFHIGESLLPMNMPIFERLGLLPQVKAIGTMKLGADFPAPNERGYSVFRFSRTLDPGTGYAVQVRREQLDELLFRHAASCGVDAREGTEVLRVEFHAEGGNVHTRSEDGSHSTLRADYVVDASGRSTLLGNALKLKRKHEQHQSAALFAHFAGVTRRPGDDAGNVSVYRFPSGWVWMIPLPGDVMSIGAVCYPEYLKQRGGDNAEFLIKTLQRIPDARERMKHARLIGHLHATGNYSYTCSRMGGPRWLMVGDAYAFLDPIFSSGVFFAMNSAEQAAATIDAILDEPRREPALQRAYTRNIKRGLGQMSWFICRFASPAMARLFSHPRNVLQLERAMISMLAGDVFGNRRVWWRLQLFKLIYFLTWAQMWRRSVRNARLRRRQASATFEGENLV